MISYEMLVGAAQSRNRICRRRHRRFMLHIPQTQFPEQSGRRRRRRCYCRLAQLAGICDFPSPCFRKEEDHCGMKILQWRNFVFHIPPFLPPSLSVAWAVSELWIIRRCLLLSVSEAPLSPLPMHLVLRQGEFAAKKRRAEKRSENGRDATPSPLPCHACPFHYSKNDLRGE